jgi:hypothetical protein
MLGQPSVAMTLDTYADVFDDDLDAVATASNDARWSLVTAKTQSIPRGEELLQSRVPIEGD